MSSTVTLPSTPLPRRHLQPARGHAWKGIFLAVALHIPMLVESLAEAVESGTRDQHSEALINELTSHFDKCQQLLNSISGSITTKAMTVDGQKRKQEETKQLFNQRKDFIARYRNSVEELASAYQNR